MIGTTYEPGTETMTRAWLAIGTQCEVVVSAPDLDRGDAERLADTAERTARTLLEDLDRSCSRFRADSELMQLRHGTAVPVSSTLGEALAAALRTARATDGLVDPTVLTALVASGYDADLDIVRDRPSATVDPVAAGGAAPVPAPGYWRVHLDAGHREVLVPHRVEIDLGSSAKAWAADWIAERLGARGVLPAGTGVLVNLGGDLALGGRPPTGGWRISVDDGSPEDERPIVTVRDGGLATSSTQLRTWHQGGSRRHHIIDPRTGDTAPDLWQTVTVAARTCELANAASTAAIVLGEEAPAWLAARGVHARLRARDGSVHRVGGWPEDRS
ncbi:MAG TPA: FAD:protein FMN transferase [Microlunatus sp.]|nr:FAD:protein FMN transferase [Microlunatus sp.]